MTNFADERWEDVARRWRESAGRAQDLRFNAPAFVRWMKHSGYIKDYVCVPDGDLTSEGKYEPQEGKVYFRNSTWNGAEKGISRNVWTLVHECTHVILSHKETRLRASAAISRRGASDEIEAHRLTASIIAPFEKADFTLDTSIEDIQDRFGLSRQAAAKRLEEFQRLYRRKHGLPRPLPPGIIDFLIAQKRKGHPVTSVDIPPELAPRAAAKYEGDPCPCCLKFTLIRNALSMSCDTCGTRTGDD